MWRSILAVLAGVIAGFIIIGILETIGHTLIPPPPGMDATNMESVKQFMPQLHPAAFIAVLVGWALGSFLGGWTAASITVKRKIICALVVGALFQLSGLASLLMIPHPLWFWIVSMFIPLPASWLGGRMALGRYPRDGKERA